MHVANNIIEHTSFVGGLARPLLNNELCRLATFSRYPNNAAKSAILLAADGFVYSGQDLDDTVACFFCKSQKNEWQPTDNISETHRDLSCDCPMVTRTLCSNIPVEAKRKHNLNFQSITPSIIPQNATCDELSLPSDTDQLNTIRTLAIQVAVNVLQYSPAKNVSNLAKAEKGNKLSVRNFSQKDNAVLARVAPTKEYFHFLINQLLPSFIRSSKVKLETNAKPKIKLSHDSDELTTTCEKVSMAIQFPSSCSSNNYQRRNYCSWLSPNKLGSYVLPPQDDTLCVKYCDNYFSSNSKVLKLLSYAKLFPVLPYRNQPVAVYALPEIDYNNSHYKNRLSTFNGWPVNHTVSCVLLAQNGLVFDHEYKKVICLACNFSRTVQEVGHTIISDHKHYLPGCPLASACQEESTYINIFQSVTGLANNQVTNNQEHSSEHASVSHTSPTIDNTGTAFPESPFIVSTATTLNSVTTASRDTVAVTAAAAPISCTLTSYPVPFRGANNEFRPVSLAIATSPLHQVNLRHQNAEGCAYPDCKGENYSDITNGSATIEASQKLHLVAAKHSVISASSCTAASLESATSLTPEVPKPTPTLNDRSGVVAVKSSSGVQQKLAAVTVDEKYADLQQRIASIEKCEQENSLNVVEVAKAGFYWEDKENVLKCFTCGVRLRRKGHMAKMDGWVEHAKFSPHCQWVHRQKGQCFVDIIQELVKENKKRKITMEMVYSRCGATSSSLLAQPGLSLSADNIIGNSKKQDELR